MAAKTVTVYPVPGRHIDGVPHVVQQVPAARATELVATGAFTLSPPKE